MLLDRGWAKRSGSKPAFSAALAGDATLARASVPVAGPVTTPLTVAASIAPTASAVVVFFIGVVPSGVKAVESAGGRGGEGPGAGAGLEDRLVSLGAEQPGAVRTGPDDAAGVAEDGHPHLGSAA